MKWLVVCLFLCGCSTIENSEVLVVPNDNVDVEFDETFEWENIFDFLKLKYILPF